MKDKRSLQGEAINLLQELIRTPSFSKEEWATASLLTKFLFDQGVEVTRVGNNVLALNKWFDANKPTLLLNSHHDTVKPNQGYSIDPFLPHVAEGKLFGLGSTDAGGALVSLIASFLFFYDHKDSPFNLALAATAEEEISGSGGVEMVLPHLPPIACAIVGEPTLMQMAVAERGLLVIDATATGIAGHAAREEGDNAISKAVADIAWINSYAFPKISPLLGPVKMTVTSIQTANKAHNVVPSECTFLVDVRLNEHYTHEEVLAVMRQHLTSSLQPRSTRLCSSIIPLEHPLVQAGMDCGFAYYGSPTSSDKALLPFPALKMGPGDSARSHTADEFIFLKEIEQGIEDYIRLIEAAQKRGL